MDALQEMILSGEFALGINKAVKGAERRNILDILIPEMSTKTKEVNFHVAG